MTTLSHIPPVKQKSRSSTIIFKRDPRKSLLPPLSPHYSKLLLTQKKTTSWYSRFIWLSVWWRATALSLYYYYIYVHTYLYILVMLSLIIDYVCNIIGIFRILVITRYIRKLVIIHQIIWISKFTIVLEYSDFVFA